MQAIEEALQRWTGAGVLDEATADRIRAFESSRAQPTGLRWQVLLALIFGATLLAAGISLFVAAHWDELSPTVRFTVVMVTLILLHVLGLLVRQSFEALSIALHGIGTIAAGGAVALVGQIFNMQEHWPAGILLWALCALAGWALLRDQVQQTICLLLLPAWILCEWMVRTQGYRGDEVLVPRLVAVFAAVYLTGFVESKKKLVFGVLFAVASMALVVAVAWLSFDFRLWQNLTEMPVTLRLFGWICVAGLPLLAAWRLYPPSMAPVAAVLLAAIVLPYVYWLDHEWYTSPYRSPHVTVLAHVIVALLSAFLAWWGVRRRSRAVTNYGVVCFALTVLWFYFSDVMDKLDRSLSLILLGVLFLGGGWLLEKGRRRLVRHIEEAA
jgi:uncharacterized membrane protein